MPRPTDDRILEALCMHEVYRRLGFPSSQIHLTLAKEADTLSPDYGHGCLYASLKIGAQDVSENPHAKNEFHVRIRRYEEDWDKLGPIWDEAIAWFNKEASDVELIALFAASTAKHEMEIVRELLIVRGFLPPRAGTPS